MSRNTAIQSRRKAITLISALSSLVLLSLLALFSSPFLPRPTPTWLQYDHDAETLAEATRVPQIVSSEAAPTDVHIFHEDGEVIVGTDAPRHPVFQILEHANSEWESVVNTHGADEARAMLHRSAGRHRTASQVPPLHLFTPIPASLLKSRQREAEILPDTFTLTLHSGVSRITYGNLSHSVSEAHRAARVEHLLAAIQPFSQSLPNLRATFSLLPHPRQALPFQASDALSALAADQPLPNSPVRFRSQADPSGSSSPHARSIHEDDLKLLEGIMTRQEGWNWEGGCRVKPDVEEAQEDDEGKKSDLSPPIRFVGSPKARSDPCVHRALTELHPFFTSDSTHHTRLSPIVSDTSAPWASDILLPPLDFFAAQRTEDIVRVVPWENKTSGVFWRGPAIAQDATHPTSPIQQLFDITISPEQELILPSEDESFLIDRKFLKDVFTYDVRSSDDEAEVRRDEAGWKFLVDMGEGTRMQERMASGSLVFRPVLLGDWFEEHSMPWIHYVPVQPDLSDLPSLIAFFKRHDTLAQRIADAGQTWARERLSQEHARERVREVLEGFASLGLEEQR